MFFFSFPFVSSSGVRPEVMGAGNLPRLLTLFMFIPSESFFSYFSLLSFYSLFPIYFFFSLTSLLLFSRSMPGRKDVFIVKYSLSGEEVGGGKSIDTIVLSGSRRKY